jgi:hypothetical protein
MSLLSRQIAEREHRPNRWPIAAAVATAAVLTACYFGYQWMTRAMVDRRAGPVHVFKGATTRPFLSESDALAKAREAMAMDGLDVTRWQPRADDRSKAPDGTPDRYLVRNATNANQGTIVFADPEAPATSPTTRQAIPERIVNVEWFPDRIECRVIVPK